MLPIALSLTMLVQGFVAVRVGILKARTFNDLGVAGCVGAVLISRGAGYAFAVGVVLCFLVYGKDFFRRWNTYDKVKDPVSTSASPRNRMMKNICRISNMI